ncbi:MAG: hypothetical protein KY461_05545 [Actinobacteria bacterium]|nr:hypothetical protein [Actinomycetota bacterium]
MASDLDLIQALYQTDRSLSTGDAPQDDHVRSLAAKVAGLLDRYQVEDRGVDEVAYREQGADKVDLTLPDAPEQKGRLQAALIAYADRPSAENAAHASAAIDDLVATFDDA